MLDAIPSLRLLLCRLPLRLAGGLIAMGMAAHEADAQGVGVGAAGAHAEAAPGAATTQASATGGSKRVFFSGHSLLSPPIPEFAAAIARSQGTSMRWNQQSLGGSPIRWRSRGREDNAAPWSGYRQGDDRHGKPIDVLAEFKSGASVGGPYDTLVITEMHALLGTLLWNDTVRYLRHFHERFIEANASGTTWFYESWLDVSDKDDPRRWIAYERDASVAWQCIAARVNASLALEGRNDRIRSLPAGAALVHLVEKATQGSGLAGITLASTKLTVNSLLQDDVHLTRLGSYYIALVIDATLSGRFPTDAWRPSDISAAQAQALQSVASTFVLEQVERAPRSLDQCRAFILDGFITRYWAYVRDAAFLKQFSAPKAYFDWARFLVEWHVRLRRRDARNPLNFDPSTDRSFWLPAP
jgi:hypothetical protein